MKILDTIKHDQSGETVVLAQSASGTRIALCSTPGFSTSSGHFGLRFGSTDTHFRLPSGQEVEVPGGSAHYLEHKLFEGREEKVFDRFGKLGARFNGGTSFRTTTYHFTTASKFKECLDVLVDFVQHPLITEERVEKERGIIEQEVRMYADHPGFAGTFLLHEALYAKHGIRVEPGGTVGDVRAINAQHLQDCFDGFYRPSAMCLSLAGDFDTDEVLAYLETKLDVDDTSLATKIYPTEPAGPHADWLEKEFPVTRPHVWIGWRAASGEPDGHQRLHTRLINSLVLDLAFDVSSDTHADLYQRGVIDDSFGCHWSGDSDWGHVIASGLCDDPKAFVAEIRKAAEAFAAKGPAKADFERLKRAAWGGLISGMQTPTALAGNILSSMLGDVRPFEMLNVLASVSYDDICNAAKELFKPEQSAVAVLKPAAQ
ncbi:MAG: insulinase family protein [Planctomycetes bacterium]|nr:insulinase family protein [Planctomycetota bacterium]MCP4772197.1 insulinase family protein [Planctomycetota bacterium]MCP4861253.1 insulinase family protein [Planctomycetota bacterium]